MTWPHLLSFSRIIAGPLVAALVLARAGDVYLVAAVLFAFACLTDAVDGKLARYKRSVSPLGIFLDTTSDKVLVSTVLIAMTVARLVPAWMPIVIISREFLISGLRSFAASHDRIISAHAWGKGKAAVTMVGICAVLTSAAGSHGGVLRRVESHTFWHGTSTAALWLLGLASILTVVSGIRYVVDAFPVFREEELPPSVGHNERPRIVVGDGR